MSGQGYGGGNSAFGRLAIASSYQVAALPYDPATMRPGGQGGRYARGWALGGLSAVQGMPHTNIGAHRPAFGTAVSYGAEPAGGSASDVSVYQQAGAVAGSYASAADVRRALAKKQADLAALVSLKAKQPWMAAVLDWQISRIDADIQALNQKLALQVEGEDATRGWRSLGQTGGAIAIVGGVIGVGILASILAKSLRKKNPKRRKNGAVDGVKTVLQIAGAVAAPVAMAVSYSRNQSLLWAAASGAVGLPYLMYVGLSKKSKKRKNPRRRNRSR